MRANFLFAAQCVGLGAYATWTTNYERRGGGGSGSKVGQKWEEWVGETSAAKPCVKLKCSADWCDPSAARVSHVCLRFQNGKPEWGSL